MISTPLVKTRWTTFIDDFYLFRYEYKCTDFKRQECKVCVIFIIMSNASNNTIFLLIMKRCKTWRKNIYLECLAKHVQRQEKKKPTEYSRLWEQPVPSTLRWSSQTGGTRGRGRASGTSDSEQWQWRGFESTEEADTDGGCVRPELSDTSVRSSVRQWYFRSYHFLPDVILLQANKISNVAGKSSWKTCWHQGTMTNGQIKLNSIPDSKNTSDFLGKPVFDFSGQIFEFASPPRSKSCWKRVRKCEVSISFLS